MKAKKSKKRMMTKTEMLMEITYMRKVINKQERYIRAAVQREIELQSAFSSILPLIKVVRTIDQEKIIHEACNTMRAES
jgi:hypothetical protein